MRGRFGIAAGVIVGLLLMVVLPAAAATDTGVVQSYRTDQAIRQGMIVALTPADSTKVAPLTNRNATDMFGVAISPTEAPISVAGTTGQQIYVATSGQYNVLVSTQNGAVHAGDYISISALNGVGMKAEDAEATVLGRASADLTSDRIIDSDVAVQTTHGPASVALGSIPVSIMIADNPNAGQGGGSLPGFLRTFSNNLANKPVAAPRVYLAIAVLVLSGFISASVLYSGIRGGIVSIGRNPLAKPAIVGGIMQSVGIGGGIFVIGLVGVYLLLRL